MNRLHRIQIAIFVTFVAVTGSLAAHHAFKSEMLRRIHEEYGWDPPGLNWADGEATVNAEGERCRAIDYVKPFSHWNWKGEVWQDPYLPWENIQILTPSPRELDHGRTGPVRVGDVVCGWADHGTEATVYRPTGRVLACLSTEIHLDPPC